MKERGEGESRHSTNQMIKAGSYLRKKSKCSGTRQCFSLSSLLFNTVLEVLARTLKQKKRKKTLTGIQVGKKVVKLSLFTNVILYVENPKKIHKKLLELINKFSKVAKHKNQLCLYPLIMNNPPKNEIKKIIPVTIESKFY